MGLIDLIDKTFLPAGWKVASAEIAALAKCELARLLYGGTKVICPCCGGSFSHFLPGGTDRRPGARCPGCDSLERHRLLCLYLRQKTLFFKKRLRVLDIAPMVFFQAKFRRMRNLDYVSADLLSPFVMRRMDITDMPEKNSSFDCVICYHVLEHIQDDRKAMREIHRVLKPGGWAVLQSPVDLKMKETFEDRSIVDPAERKRFFGQEDHVRAYGADYVDRIKEAGFEVRIDDFAAQFSKEDVKKYVIDAGEKIFFCVKRQ